MKLRDFNETFADELRDPDFVTGYLQASLEDGGIDTFLVALQDVAQANGGMTRVAEAASLNRESLYRALSEQGNPGFRTIQAVLEALGYKIAFVPMDRAAA